MQALSSHFTPDTIGDMSEGLPGKLKKNLVVQVCFSL